MTAPIAVAIVTYNSADHIDGCLDALSDIASDIDVVVVDNNSHDATVAIAQAAAVAPRIIRNSHNVGFAIAVNQAIASTRSPIIVLINPDCKIDSGSLRTLVQRLDDDSTVGVIAPTIVHPGGRLSVRSAGYQPTFPRMLSHALGLSRAPFFARVFKGFNLFPAGETYPDTDVEWVSGACLAVRRSTWDTIGGLSIRWFMYAEDIDFCRRVIATGARVVHTAQAHATHVLGASSETSSGPVWTLWIENLADYYRHEFAPSRFTFRCWKLVTASIYASRGIVYWLRSRARTGLRPTWKREAHKFFAYARAVLAA